MAHKWLLALRFPWLGAEGSPRAECWEAVLKVSQCISSADMWVFVFRFLATSVVLFITGQDNRSNVAPDLTLLFI